MFGVTVWRRGLTQKETKSIENIQKLAFKIILQTDYVNYQQARKQFSALSLTDRRDKLCLKFVKKNIKSVNNLFTKLANNVTRNSKKNIL